MPKSNNNNDKYNDPDVDALLEPLLKLNEKPKRTRKSNKTITENNKEVKKIVEVKKPLNSKKPVEVKISVELNESSDPIVKTPKRIKKKGKKGKNKSKNPIMTNIFDFDFKKSKKRSKVTQIVNYSKFSKVGVVTAVADGIVSILGMYGVSYGETVNIVCGTQTVSCLVLNIESTKVGAILLDTDALVRPGLLTIRTGVLMSIPVSEELLGRVIDPTGKPLDGKGSYSFKESRMVESIAPSIISRSPVNLPLETGLKIVDSMIPIGHGQRELIIGDSKTGKTSIAIDAILNQKSTDTISIYVAIGQKRSSVSRISRILESNNCLRSTVIVAATASDPAALQYIAPYSGVAVAEFFMGLNLRSLIIYDDLSKHAVSYRQFLYYYVDHLVVKVILVMFFSLILDF